MFNCIHATICRLHINFQSSTDGICEFLRQKLAANELIPHELLCTLESVLQVRSSHTWVWDNTHAIRERGYSLF